ncbi:unnamed protein product [Lathyrus oleraceus]
MLEAMRAHPLSVTPPPSLFPSHLLLLSVFNIVVLMSRSGLHEFSLCRFDSVFLFFLFNENTNPSFQIGDSVQKTNNTSNLIHKFSRYIPIIHQISFKISKRVVFRLFLNGFFLVVS